MNWFVAQSFLRPVLDRRTAVTGGLRMLGRLTEGHQESGFVDARLRELYARFAVVLLAFSLGWLTRQLVEEPF